MLGTLFPWCAVWAAELRTLFAAYVEAKQRQNVLDYDDLLLYWAQTVSDRSLADDIGGRFDHVLVDEYQDTNRLQSSILLALKPDGRGLTVVGDDAQSIYSFRAATVRNILDFPGQFSPAAEIITLNRNYRSTQVMAMSHCRRACRSVTSAVTIDDDQDQLFQATGSLPEIIQQAIWLYFRFTLSFRDVEDLLAARGIIVSYETVRRWVNHFGPKIAADLAKRRPKPHTIWHLDEVYLKIDGRLVYLWRAVDAEGEVLDVLVQTRRNKQAALKLMRKPHW